MLPYLKKRMLETMRAVSEDKWFTHPRMESRSLKTVVYSYLKLLNTMHFNLYYLKHYLFILNFILFYPIYLMAVQHRIRTWAICQVASEVQQPHQVTCSGIDNMQSYQFGGVVETSGVDAVSRVVK